MILTTRDLPLRRCLIAIEALLNKVALTGVVSGLECEVGVGIYITSLVWSNVLMSGDS